MIDHEFYRYHLARSRRDSRLSLADRLFYEGFVNLLDTIEPAQEYLHEPMRTLIEEMNLSMGAITNAIPRLIEYGYIRGSKYRNERNLESWRLYLLDLRAPGAAQGATVSSSPLREVVDVKRYQIDNLTITITVEKGP